MTIFQKLLVTLPLAMSVCGAFAGIEIKATYTDKQGAEITETTNFTAEAPLHVLLTSNPTDLDPAASIEWHIRNQVTGTSITRYEQDTEYTLTEAGLTEFTVNVRVDDEVVETASLGITISESVLEMPNAFTPNGDQHNDKYQAKQTSKSIVEFHGYIFNRWGQKLYDWTDWVDVESGWDGTYNGKPVKDGVYYVYVKARGADGVEYNIRRDVNLLRGFNPVESTTP